MLLPHISSMVPPTPVQQCGRITDHWPNFRHNKAGCIWHKWVGKLGNKRSCWWDRTFTCWQLEDLTYSHPGIEHLVTNIDVWLMGHAMIRPTPGFIWGAARKEAKAHYGNVIFGISSLYCLHVLSSFRYEWHFYLRGGELLGNKSRRRNPPPWGDTFQELRLRAHHLITWMKQCNE